MLVMREAQMTTFEQAATQSFESRLTAHLRKHHRERLADYSDEAVVEYIRECVTRAKELYELETEQAIACYAEIPLILGDDFEVNPRYLAIPDLLAKQSFNPSTRAKIALALAYQVKVAQRGVQ